MEKIYTVTIKSIGDLLKTTACSLDYRDFWTFSEI